MVFVSAFVFFLLLRFIFFRVWCSFLGFSEVLALPSRSFPGGFQVWHILWKCLRGKRTLVLSSSLDVCGKKMF